MGHLLLQDAHHFAHLGSTSAKDHEQLSQVEFPWWLLLKVC
jgi:hypothetical protein